MITKKESVKIEPTWSPCSNHVLTRWNNNVVVTLITDEGIINSGKLAHQNDIWDISFSPYGKYLAVTTRKSCTIWDW